MSYIGNQPTSVAFLTDQFSGNGSTTVFTMSVAPATTSSILVAITGVVQDPSTYSVTGTTLTFSAAPPSGTGNISVRYLGIPASGVTTTAYRTVTEFTATAGQTTFTPPSYTVGYLNVYMNGVLLGSADYTATNGTTVVLASGAVAGALITTESFYVSSVLNAIPATAGAVNSTYIANGAVGAAQIATGGITPTQLDTQSQYTGFKNRIINGAMMIDQRNAGAALNSAASGSYGVDRFVFVKSGSAVFNIQQNAGSVTPPAGFTKYLGFTVGTGATVNSGDYYLLQHKIEGYNFADMAYGTANAAITTLSFWVRSSLTGTFSGSYRTDVSTRTRPFTYTISSANTWEQKTITVAGDTSGTWGTTNNLGLEINFNLGVGSTFLGTDGIWAGSTYFGAAGSVNVAATSGATFYITGVQLEKGSTATSFDYRPYGTELALCQRYYEIGKLLATGYGNASYGTLIGVPLKVNKRTSPTGTVADYNANTVNMTSIAIAGIDENSMQVSGTSTTAYYRASLSFTASAEL